MLRKGKKQMNDRNRQKGLTSPQPRLSMPSASALKPLLSALPEPAPEPAPAPLPVEPAPEPEPAAAARAAALPEPAAAAAADPVRLDSCTSGGDFFSTGEESESDRSTALPPPSDFLFGSPSSALAAAVAA